MKDKLWRVAVMAAIVAIAWFGGTPEGLKPQVWQLFGIYLATIVGLVLKPFPVPITVLLGVATSSNFIEQHKRCISWLQQYSIMVDLRSLRIIRCVW